MGEPGFTIMRVMSKAKGIGVWRVRVGESRVYKGYSRELG